MPVTGGFGFNPAVAAKRGPNGVRRAALVSVPVNGGKAHGAVASKPEAASKVREKSGCSSCLRHAAWIDAVGVE